mgnify:FL=1
MKNKLLTISKIGLLAFTILVSQACQEDYEMVDPPMITDYDDDLDEEVVLQKGLESYFVTQFGEGDMDGTSWDQAMDVAGFRKLLSGSIDLSKSTIYMSQGKYVMSETGGLGVIIRKDIKAIKGGYSLLSEGTDLTNRRIDTYKTVISGDVNGNNQADSGDCGLLLVKGGIIGIEGVTFQYGYLSNNDAKSNECGSGIYINGNVNSTSVELTDCIIRDCKTEAVNGQGGVAGGTAILIASGSSKLNNVKFLDNAADSRGGAIRCNSNKAVVFMNNCLITVNSVRELFGVGIQISSGHICMNNTTIVGNPGKGAALNGGGSFMLANSTIVGHDIDQEYGAFRCETSIDGDTKFINNLLISENSTAPSFILNGANKEAYSMGYNLYQRVNNFTMGVSDTAYPTLVNGNLTEEGVYKWNIDQIGQVGGYATKQAVINAVKSFNPAASPMVNLGEVFVEWMGEDAFGLDQRGVTRNPDKMQMGAYDAVLSN